MGKPGATGLSRIVHAWGYSWKGLQAVWQYEAAFRQEVVLALIFIPVSFWLAASYIELILLVCSVIWILIAELINSAIEAVVDRVGVEAHELSGRAKDIGSAVVMVSLLLFVFVWSVIGYQHFSAL